MAFSISDNTLCPQIRRKMVEKAKEGTLKPVSSTNGEVKAKKRGRWDQTVETDASAPKKKASDATWEKDEVCDAIPILLNNKIV